MDACGYVGCRSRGSLKIDTDEITSPVDRRFRPKLRLQSAPKRQEKYCTALSQIACYAESSRCIDAELHIGEGEKSWEKEEEEEPGCSVVMTESGRVRPKLEIYRPSVSVEERRTPPRIHFARAECFASFIRETAPERVLRTSARIERGSYPSQARV